MRKFPSLQFAGLSIAFMLIAALSGCYRHVISVDGVGSHQYDLYEPHYRPEEETPKSTAIKILPSKVAKPK